MTGFLRLSFASLIKSVASKKCTVALNGSFEFDMFSEPLRCRQRSVRSISMRDGFSQADAKNELSIDFEN
jgi:hypothetical protein